MSILVHKEMIAAIDANPPVIDEEFEAAVKYWRERERGVPHVGVNLDHSLASISRVEIEFILSTRKFRDDSYVRQIRGSDLKPSKTHGGARTKGGEKFAVTIISEAG